MSEKDVGKNRAAECFQKLEELNDSVKCTLSTEPLTENLVKDFDVIFYLLLMGKAPYRIISSQKLLKGIT